MSTHLVEHLLRRRTARRDFLGGTMNIAASTLETYYMSGNCQIRSFREFKEIDELSNWRPPQSAKRD